MSPARAAGADRSARVFVAVLLTGALALAGCGGGGASDTAAGRSASSASSSAAPTGSATAAPTTSAAPSAAPPATTAGGTGAATTAPGTSGDDIDVTVPVGTPTTLPPVAAGAPAATTGATVALTRTEAVTGEARGAGQVAGPAVRLTVTVTNTGGSALSLGAVTVDLRDAADAPASPLSGPGASPFAGTLAPGAAASGVYVFALADDDRNGTRLLVTLAAGVPVVVVAADLPR